MIREINLGRIKIGGGKGLVLIAGPCVIESESLCLELAKKIKDIAAKNKVPYIFKTSFDKANRLSLESFRGPGLKMGLRVLEKIKRNLSLTILTDIHCQKELDEVSKVVDIIQIPAFLCRQTDIVVAAARTGKVINIKKGQFLAPWDILPIIKKIESTGNKKIILTERGACFGYNNLVADFRSLKIMREYGYPVVFDATHSVQLPGANKGCSGGQREFVEGLSRAAVAFGCDGLFLEVHLRPDKALCDGPNMINLATLDKLLRQVKLIETALRKES